MLLLVMMSVYAQIYLRSDCISVRVALFTFQAFNPFSFEITYFLLN